MGYLLETLSGNSQGEVSYVQITGQAVPLGQKTKRRRPIIALYAQNGQYSQ
jgi:hypothetical protein